jgi:phosphoglycolate phosphatase-like HAD superfamily hydrolase
MSRAAERPVLPVHLVLFDVDGTLTHSDSIDAELYLRSLAEVFGFTDVDCDWSAYRHTTDSGILHEVFEMRMGREPSAVERAVFRTHFVGAVAAAAAQTPFREIDGARRALDHIEQLPSHRVALATGGWSDSARCKLLSAGLSYDAFPAASADDAIARASIMRIAIDRAISQLGGLLEGVVYVGDAVWDARACRQLGLPFIGIAAGADADRLRAEGARAVLADYSDIAELCTVLEQSLRRR